VSISFRSLTRSPPRLSILISRPWLPQNTHCICRLRRIVLHFSYGQFVENISARIPWKLSKKLAMERRKSLMLFFIQGFDAPSLPLNESAKGPRPRAPFAIITGTSIQTRFCILTGLCPPTNGDTVAVAHRKWDICEQGTQFCQSPRICRPHSFVSPTERGTYV